MAQDLSNSNLAICSATRKCYVDWWNCVVQKRAQRTNIKASSQWWSVVWYQPDKSFFFVFFLNTAGRIDKLSIFLFDYHRELGKNPISF